jgi:hypothetical protein
MKPCLLVATLVALTVGIVPTVQAASSVFDWAQHDWTRPRPAVVQPATPSTQERPGKPPSDAVVLFDGASLPRGSA